MTPMEPVSRGLEQYERLKLLGKGSFGQAWKVRHTVEDQVFVAKQIKCANKQELDEALGEASVLSKLHHPFIVAYHDVIKSSAKLVTILMEFCGGGDLSEKIAKRKYRHQHFDESTIKLWFCQVADAVAYLHQKGILHRDIKCGNIFLADQDIAKLGDFGIARVLDRNAVQPSERTTRTPVGTPMNMSPEICRGERYGQKADIWALGCVLYELASLRPAFMAYDMESLVRKIKRGHHDKFLPRNYSVDLARIIDQMLQVNAVERPTAGELLLHAYFEPALKVMQAIKSGAGPGLKVDDPAESQRTAPDILVLEAPSTALPHEPLMRPKQASPQGTPQGSPKGTPHGSPRMAQRAIALGPSPQAEAAPPAQPQPVGPARLHQKAYSDGDQFQRHEAPAHFGGAQEQVNGHGGHLALQRLAVLQEEDRIDLQLLSAAAGGSVQAGADDASGWQQRGRVGGLHLPQLSPHGSPRMGRRQTDVGVVAHEVPANGRWPPASGPGTPSYQHGVGRGHAPWQVPMAPAVAPLSRNGLAPPSRHGAAGGGGNYGSHYAAQHSRWR